MKHQVVVAGGGFGGLYAALNLRKASVEVTVVDRQNFHLFQPLLYQVATGALSPANISAPLRAVLKHQKNTKVLMTEIIGMHAKSKTLLLKDGEVPYDTLIVATGSEPSYFGNEQWRHFAPGLKTIENAVEIRRRILFAFEMAEREHDPQKQREWLTFVIVGAGPTGVEMAGALSELARLTLREEFRNIDTASSSIVLIENSHRVLSNYPEKLSNKALYHLKASGIEIKLSTKLTDVQASQVILQSPKGIEHINSNVILWTAGVIASPLGAAIAKETGAELDRGHRIKVESDLTIAGHPEIFVIGDLASAKHKNGKPLPGLAPVAMQQGSYVAKVIKRRLQGKIVEPFEYRDKGEMATIGRAAAVIKIKGLQFDGLPAWITWLFVHLLYLVQFENRILVLIQWAWNYFTRNRSARLITKQTES